VSKVIKDIHNDTNDRMTKTTESFKGALSKIRTGRANTSLLDHVTVEHYGSVVPLNQTCNINVEDARTLMLNVWEKDMVQVIESAITSSDLGLNPATSGTIIRIPMPPLTEERRKDLVKLVRQEAEAAKVAIRNIRRDANSMLKDLLKEKEISEDDERDGQEEIQKTTDQYISAIDKVTSEKEKDLMEL